MVEILTEQNFEEKVLNDHGKVLVEFFATWCPHCQRMAPIVEDVASRVAGEATVYQVDIDQSPDLAREYAPNGVPTFILFEDGVRVTELVGEQTEAKLVELLS